jgi:inosose dehydratase
MLDKNKVSVGITPTCWTNDDSPLLGNDISFGQIVSEMALAGYVGCSIGHKFPSDDDEILLELGRRGLRVSEPWASTFFTVNKMHDRTIEMFETTMKRIKYLGSDIMVVAELGHAVHQQGYPPVANKPMFSEDQWKALTEGLNTLGKIANDAGMTLCYHHHMGTGVMFRPEVDRLMNETDENGVHLLLDTGHLYWAGDDPVKLAQDYATRIRHVHLKDIRQDKMEEANAKNLSFIEGVEEGVFTVPGDGAIDFKPIFDALGNADYAGWLMVEAEQDAAKANPLEYAMKARKFLRDVAGV